MRAALAFLTPFGRPEAPTSRSLRWFPAVGLLIGGMLGFTWWVGNRLWLPLVAAACVVLADLAATNLLHLDGLADSADGLLPPFGLPEQRLEVMADPTVGAFGLGTVVAVLLVRFAALAQATPALDAAGAGHGVADGFVAGWLAMPLALGGIWCVSRTAMAAAALSLPYVRPGGLAQSFLGGTRVGSTRRPPWPLVVGGAVGGLAAAIGAGWRGVLGVIMCASGALVVILLARRRIGGFTGDVLGAAGMVGETAALLALALR